MRDFLAVAIMILLPCWFGFAAYLAVEVGIDTVSAIGVGTVGGILLKAFSDMWQFYFRRAPEWEHPKKKEDK